MYQTADYILRGVQFLNNRFFPAGKKVASLMFYGTTNCDSKCKHCLIWAKKSKEHLSKEKIVEIMHNRCITQRTVIGLEGGEFLLHPEANEILSWFKENHPRFDILSNALKPEKLIQVVTLYTPHRLYISLDGTKETYEYMRGVNGYDKAIRVIEACKNIVPISLMFTLTPYNTFMDMDHVISLAEKYDIDIRIGIYNNIDFFDTKNEAHKNVNWSDKDMKKILPKILNTSENIDFLLLYDEWTKGNVKLKCFSIRDSLVIHPNGDVPICQNLDVKLGNVHENSLDEIFNSKSTINLHRQYCRECNKCWINFHRKYDVVFYRSLEKIFSKKVVSLILENYQWTDNKKVSYKRFLKEKCKLS
jgi:MoaA/NifB/PqqE/SkfB family radical SAM enzyme